MSNVLELTDVPISSKGNERKSGQLPSKLRFTPASELSLVNNVKSGLIEKRVEKYNLRHSQQLDNNAVAPTAAVAATTQPVGTQLVDSNGVPVVDPNQQVVVPDGTVNAQGAPAAPVAGEVAGQPAVAPQPVAPEAAQVVAQDAAQQVVPEAGQPVADANAVQAVQATPDGSAPAISLAPLAEQAQQPEAGTPAVPLGAEQNQVPVAASQGEPVEEQVQQQVQQVPEQPVLSAEDERKSREVLANSQIMKNANMTVNKLEGSFGTLGLNFGVNVKPEGLIPKALSVPTAYRDRYLGIFKQSDIYKNLADGDASLISVSKELANLNKEEASAEVQQVPEQVIPVAPVAPVGETPLVPVIPVVPGAAEEVKDGSQPAISLALADFSNTASEEEKPAEEQEVTQEGQPVPVEPAANWKNLFDENKDNPTETPVEEKPVQDEEAQPQKVKKRGLSAEELEQRKLIGNFGEQLKEVRNLKDSEETPDAGLLEKENSILGMMSSVVGGDKITERTEDVPEVENNEETTDYTEEQQGEEPVVEEAPVEEAAEPEPYVNKFQGMFGKLNDDSAPAEPVEEAPAEEVEQPVEEVVEEQAPSEPVQEEQYAEQPVEGAPVEATMEYSDVQVPVTEETNTNKFLGDFASEEPTEEISEEPVETTNKFLGDFANEEPAEEVQETPAESTNKFLGDFANEEPAEEVPQEEVVAQASTGKFLGGFEQEDNAPGKFLGEFNTEVEDVPAEEPIAEEVQDDGQGKFFGDVVDEQTTEESQEEQTDDYSEPVEEEIQEEQPVDEAPVEEEQQEESETVENSDDTEIAYLDTDSKELEPEVGLESQDVNNNGRLIIDEKPVIDAIANDGLNEEIKGYAEETAQSLFEHNKRLDEMDQDSLPVRHKKAAAKSELSQDLDNMDIASAVRKHLTKAQSDLVDTVNAKIEAIEGDLLAAVDQKIKQAEKQAEEANRSKEELEQQLRELVSREEERNNAEQVEKKGKAKKKKKVVVDEDDYDEEDVERVTVASKEDVEEVKKKLRSEVASEVNRQLDEAQLILANAVDQKINSAKLELTAAVNTQVQNAQLELRGAVNEQIENFKNEMVAPNEEIRNAQEELSRSVTQQVENAQLALSIAINKQVEEAQEKLENAKIELQGIAASKEVEASPEAQEEPQEEINQDNWTGATDDYPAADSSEEQKEVAATIASWINEDNDYIESNDNAEEQQPEETVEAESQVEEPQAEETPVEEVPVEAQPEEELEEQVKEELVEEPLDESLPAPLEAQENASAVRKSHAPLVIEKLTDDEPSNVSVETTEETDNKELDQALEQVWLGNDSEALKEQGKAPFIPYSIDRYSAQTIENNDTGYNVVTASRPIKLHKKYIELLSSHLNGEAKVAETPVPETQTEVSEVTETASVEETPKAEVSTEKTAEEQQLGMEILPLKDRYCNVVTASRPIKVPSGRKDNIVKRLNPSQDSQVQSQDSQVQPQDGQVQSKKDLLNSLKTELNSNEFDFMRYDETQEEERKLA